MKKALVVYHSRTGHTQRVAEALALRLDADIEDIEIVQPMAGWLGYVMCALESLAELTPALRPMRKDPAAYELVVIGTPVWFWNLSSPVRSWLARHRLKHRVAFFCTMGGSGSGRAFATMAELAGRPAVATLALLEKDLAGPFDDKLDAFVGQLSKQARQRPARTRAGARALHPA